MNFFNSEACIGNLYVTSVIFLEKITGNRSSCRNVNNCLSTFGDLELLIEVGYIDNRYLITRLALALDGELCDLLFLWHGLC